MSQFADDLLAAANRLLVRRSGQPGKLKSARIRRSISTSYYALFHFLSDEATGRLAGTGNDLRRRRRALGRTLTHAGLKRTMEKVRGASVDPSVSDVLLLPSASSEPPAFARSVATCFIDAQAKRHDADYDLNVPFSEADARILRTRVRRAIRDWRSAKSATDKDFKHALSILMLLKGQIRRDD